MATKKIFRKLTTNKGDDAVKLAPQEQVVFDAIPKTKAGIERAELVAKLEELAQTPSEADPSKMVLQTGQKPASILGYYTKHLVDSGLIEVEKIVEEPAKKEKGDDKEAA